MGLRALHRLQGLGQVRELRHRRRAGGDKIAACAESPRAIQWRQPKRPRPSWVLGTLLHR